MVKPGRKKILVSARRIEANRRNAKQSTGPRTAGGKAVSSLNSGTHWGAKKMGLLPGEDPEQFHEYEAATLEDLNPKGAVQHVLATQLVWLGWRLNFRFPRLEADVVAILEYRRLAAEHQQRLKDATGSSDDVGFAAMNDSALVQGGLQEALLDNLDVEKTLEKLARGRVYGPKYVKMVMERVNTPDDREGQKRLERFDGMERRTLRMVLEAARRMATSDSTKLGREFLSDIETDTHALDKIQRYVREALADYIKVSREFERLKYGRPAPNVAAIQIE